MNIRRIMMIRPGKRFLRQGFGQPLGFMYIISLVRQKFPDKYEIELLEQALYHLNAADMRERMRNFDPDLVCISCLSMEGNEMAEVASISKSLKPEVPVILGGPHGSVFYDLVLQNHDIDIVAIGEGELTFIDLLDALEKERPLDEVKGIAFMREGRVIKTEPREYIEDLDSLPFPAWDMIDFEVYGKQVSMNSFSHSSPWAIIFTSRACPFHCKYCHNIFGKRVRLRSPENVIEELKLLTGKYGVKEIHIVDDIFNFYLERAKLICDMIVQAGIKVKIAFPNGLRGDMMDRELIQKLKAAGAYTITYAVETGSPRLQKVITKNLNLEKVRQAIEWTYDEGLIPQAFFMMGFPGETLEEMEMTVGFACNSKLLRAWFFEVVVYPRTGLMELARKSYPGFLVDEWSMFDLRYYTSEPFYQQATGINIYYRHLDAHRRFFMRPHIILMILWRFPKNMYLVRGIIGGSLIAAESFLKIEAKYEFLKKLFTRSFKAQKAGT